MHERSATSRTPILSCGRRRRTRSGVAMRVARLAMLAVAFGCVAGGARAAEPIKPIPEQVEVNAEKAALGRDLFHDPRLSRDDTIACASCHNLSIRRRRRPPGSRSASKDSSAASTRPPCSTRASTSSSSGTAGPARWSSRSTTRCSRRSRWEACGRTWSPSSTATTTYPGRFKALYPDGISRNSVKNAIAEFMRSLTTPNSRFDRWLKGDASALSALEQHGYALFKYYGCVSCHQGANVGGNMFQVFGVLNEYFKVRGNITEADLGRFNVTGNPADRHAFKVPSLRMAAHTAPYLHDGSAATLRDAVDAMFEFQLGREAPDEDKEAIVAFIKTLAGESKELSK